DRLAIVNDLDAIERQPLGGTRRGGCFRQRGGELGVIEGGLADASFGIDCDEFLGTAAEVVAIPEARIVRKPVGSDLRLVDPCTALAGVLRTLVGFAEFFGRRRVLVPGAGAGPL